MLNIDWGIEPCYFAFPVHVMLLVVVGLGFFGLVC